MLVLLGKIGMLITFTRVIKSGWISFFRNFWVSCATVGTMIITLFVFTGILLFSHLTDNLIQNLKEKVDITVFFNEDAAESDIVIVKQELSKMSEVVKVDYISKEERLDQFKERHKDDPVILESLEELGENPLQAILNVKAAKAGSYKDVAEFLEKGKYRDLIEKVNYHQNEAIITKVFDISDAIKIGGIVIGIILALVSVLVAFNTIRLAIYSSREEISVMKLVGASNWFARGPFLLQGVLSGFFAAALNLIIFFGITWKIAPQLNIYLPGSEIFAYYYAHIWQMFLILFGIGILLGVVSSFIAVRRYLKV